MKTTPLKGMKDILPREQRIRDYVQGEILKTYRAAGFERISTPIMEDMENLDKSDGGDNLNLIFKVLKRGDKLEKALASGSEKELSDMGLRYDLTLPLSRYYAANREQLPAPFKVIQTDRVYRAERPQKGRLREFVQCDIDILGDESPNAEVELIDVTARALLAIGFSDFTVHINDRRLLRGMLESFGFAPQALDTVCVTFDKLDKVGPQGVAAGPCIAGVQGQPVAQGCGFAGKAQPEVLGQSRLQPDVFGAAMVMRFKGIAAQVDGRARIGRQKMRQPAAVVVVPVGEHGQVHPRQIHTQRPGVRGIQRRLAHVEQDVVGAGFDIKRQPVFRAQARVGRCILHKCGDLYHDAAPAFPGRSRNGSWRPKDSIAYAASSRNFLAGGAAQSALRAAAQSRRPQSVYSSFVCRSITRGVPCFSSFCGQSAL